MLLLVPASASANGETCGTAGHYFDGYYGTPGGGASEGAYGTAQIYSSSQCNDAPSGDANETGVWVLIQGGGDQYAYVQSGYIHTYGGCTQYFAQSSLAKNDDFKNKVGGCSTADGAVHSFNEQYGTGCSCEYAKIDGTVWMTTTWDPFGYWNYPFDPEFSGEADFKQSDMPGTSDTPTNFASLQGQNVNNNYYPFDCNGFLNEEDDNSTSWGNGYTTCPEFNIYSK